MSTNPPVATTRRSGPRLKGGRNQLARGGYFRPYTDDEVEFMKALDQYKRDNNKPFPTCCEVLDVLLALGYRKQK